MTGFAGRIADATLALARTWRGRLIVVVVASQLLLPARYYCAHRDPHDERFAWRMFSPMRLARCTPRISVDGQPVALASQYHEAWLELAARGRFTILEAMGHDQCARHAGSRVEVTLACKYLDEPDATWHADDICTSRELAP